MQKLHFLSNFQCSIFTWHSFSLWNSSELGRSLNSTQEAFQKHTVGWVQQRLGFHCFGAGPRLLTQACQWVNRQPGLRSAVRSSSVEARVWTQDKETLKWGFCWPFYFQRAIKGRKKATMGRKCKRWQKPHTLKSNSRQSTHVVTRRRPPAPWAGQTAMSVQGSQPGTPTNSSVTSLPAPLDFPQVGDKGERWSTPDPNPSSLTHP